MNGMEETVKTGARYTRVVGLSLDDGKLVAPDGAILAEGF